MPKQRGEREREREIWDIVLQATGVLAAPAQGQSGTLQSEACGGSLCILPPPKVDLQDGKLGYSRSFGYQKCACAGVLDSVHAFRISPRQDEAATRESSASGPAPMPFARRRSVSLRSSPLLVRFNAMCQTLREC